MVADAWTWPLRAHSTEAPHPTPPASPSLVAALPRSYVGIAFTAKANQLPLFPVVGIDSHLEITFNFVTVETVEPTPLQSCGLLPLLPRRSSPAEFGLPPPAGLPNERTTRKPQKLQRLNPY